VIPVAFLGWTLYALIVAPVVLLFALLGGLVAFAVQILLRRGLHEGAAVIGEPVFAEMWRWQGDDRSEVVCELRVARLLS